MHLKKLNDGKKVIKLAILLKGKTKSKLYVWKENAMEQIAENFEQANDRLDINKIEDEEIEILNDFVLETMENLERIEILLIDLEEDPENKTIVNDIFRPFHTVKGVSGFLNLTKINKLSHCTEYLLDDARNGKFTINDEITNVILESVDTLKNIIQHIKEVLLSKTGNLEEGIDVKKLIEKIEDVGKRALTGDSKRIGDILVESGSIKQDDLEKGLALQKQFPEKKIGDILVDEKIAEPQKVVNAIKSQKKSKTTTNLQVKVDTHKLDNMIDLTGELVIAQSILKQNPVVKSSGDQQLNQSVNHLNKIVSDLQKNAMAMRMVPIKNTFQKMVRLIRDLAKNSGKRAVLEMFGEDTEIDRNVVDELYEPMVHMIRNAVDHGLEGPSDRVQAGKDKMGTIQLKAYHKAGNIIIEIGDDGRGLNKDVLLQKAIDKGLINSDAQLKEEEIYDLIFHPGFSTAQKVTDISGRGVGMDVVKKGIEKLRGRLEIKSVLGKGSTFFISLPLTLAIIEGMVVRSGKERYILPTMTIVESIKPEKKDCYTVKGDGEMLKFRGSMIPLIHLDQVLGPNGNARQNPWEGLVVAVEHKNQRQGFVLDELIGKEEVVIKSLGETLRNVKGIAGGAILGDGKIGLILDMESLFELTMSIH